MVWVGDSAKTWLIALLVTICFGLWMGMNSKMSGSSLLARTIILILFTAVVWRIAARIASNTIFVSY